jgi:hypothetical protein
MNTLKRSLISRAAPKPVLWIGMHRSDADPDPEPNFHVDAGPDPDPD